MIEAISAGVLSAMNAGEHEGKHLQSTRNLCIIIRLRFTVFLTHTFMFVMIILRLFRRRVHVLLIIFSSSRLLCSDPCWAL